MGFDDGGSPFDPGDPGGIFAGILAEIQAALIWLFNALLAVIQFFWNLIVSLVQALLTAFKTIAKFLVTVWNDYIKKGILWLADHIQRLRDWLKRVLSPVIKFFQKLKHWYDTHILAQQLRLLAIIQKIRRILAIFRLFGFKWASKLDNVLVDIQQRIQQQISFIRGIFNQIINTLALVLDPTLFIARNIVGGTLLGNLGALKRILGYSNHGPLTTAETTYLDHNVGRYQSSTANSHISGLASSGLSDYDQSELADSRKAIANVLNGQT